MRQRAAVIASLVCSLLFIAVFSFVPWVSLAQSVTGGFPQRTIWLSSDDLTAGEVVTIYTAIHNGAEKRVAGTVAFFANDQRVGTNEFALEAGASAIVSVSWKTAAGRYSVSAKIESATAQDGSAAAFSSATTESIDITVEAPPSPAVQAVRSASGAAQDVIASSSPVVLGAATNIFQAAENFRERGKEYFERKTAKNSNVQGFRPSDRVVATSTPRAAGPLDKALDVLYDAGRIIFSSAVYFYPFFALLVFVLLWPAGRWATRR